jgi:hypothetical protein
MGFQYQVTAVDMNQVNAECNSLGQQGWELVTAYPSARAGCCGGQVNTIVLIFKRSA